ncbi:putative nuclease HARBI1 [Nilaparvata lugens]|uniref:putative nuclease HARBI1 n=1 Tax=Nilaparvata lugens TaxID=108931 RepID=UPI00193D1A2A|nr:putative nuclease HARBI1 [Nilaparvata lugens]
MDLLFSSSSEEDDQVQVARKRKNYRERINFNFDTIYEFNERFRLSPLKLEEILNEIGPIISHPTRRSYALSSKMQLCIALHWLGNGGQYHCIADAHGVSKASVCRSIRSVVEAVNVTLFTKVVDFPQEVATSCAAFYDVAGFPQVIGCIDGTLIPIDAPPEDEPAFVDRKGNHSINCMVVCGPNLEFYYVSAKWPGSVHDARVLRNSTLFQRFEGGWRPIQKSVILGDSGYPLLEWLMTPLLGNVEDNRAAAAYNRAHKKTRRLVENSLGILKEKFPCLNHLRVSPIYAGKIFKCCTALYNIAREEVNNLNEDEVEIEDGNAIDEHYENVGARYRQLELINYFGNAI